MMEAVSRLKQLTPGDRKPLTKRVLPLLLQAEGGCSTGGGCQSCGAH
jgi:hypothetical protein